MARPRMPVPPIVIAALNEDAGCFVWYLSPAVVKAVTELPQEKKDTYRKLVEMSLLLALTSVVLRFRRRLPDRSENMLGEYQDELCKELISAKAADEELASFACFTPSMLELSIAWGASCTLLMRHEAIGSLEWDLNESLAERLYAYQKTEGRLEAVVDAIVRFLLPVLGAFADILLAKNSQTAIDLCGEAFAHLADKIDQWETGCSNIK